MLGLNRYMMFVVNLTTGRNSEAGFLSSHALGTFITIKKVYPVTLRLHVTQLGVGTFDRDCSLSL